MTRPTLRNDWSLRESSLYVLWGVLDGEEGIALLHLVVGPIALATPLATTVGMVEEAMLTAELLQGINNGNGAHSLSSKGLAASSARNFPRVRPSSV